MQQKKKSDKSEKSDKSDKSEKSEKSECCEKIEVVGGGDAKKKHSEIFSTYAIESKKINGNIQYTSHNGRWALTFQGGYWQLQNAKDR